MNEPAQVQADPERSCYRKRPYPSEVTAQSVATHVWNTRKVPLRVYACELCNQWHLTKQSVPPPQDMKPGWHDPLRPRNERKRFKEQRRRRARGRK